MECYILTGKRNKQSKQSKAYFCNNCEQKLELNMERVVPHTSLICAGCNKTMYPSFEGKYDVNPVSAILIIIEQFSNKNNLSLIASTSVFPQNDVVQIKTQVKGKNRKEIQSNFKNSSTYSVVTKITELENYQSDIEIYEKSNEVNVQVKHERSANT